MLIWLKLNAIARSVETGLGRLTLAEAVTNVDPCPFYCFLRRDLLP